MTKANAAQTTATETQAPEKAPSKMQRAKALRDEIYAKGYDLGGLSQRQVFITRAMAEIGLTQAGANTYFQNLSNAARGQGLYKYNKTEKKPGAEGEAGLPGGKAPTKAAVKAAEAKVAVDLSKRYQVWKKNTQVNSFGKKADAEAYAAQVKGLEVRDSKAKAS